MGSGSRRETRKKRPSNHIVRDQRDVLTASCRSAMFFTGAPCFRHRASILSAPINLFINMRRLGQMRLLTLTLATLSLLAPIASADAPPPVRAGLLQCQGGLHGPFVVG